jgi:hypothetical protein
MVTQGRDALTSQRSNPLYSGHAILTTTWISPLSYQWPAYSGYLPQPLPAQAGHPHRSRQLLLYPKHGENGAEQEKSSKVQFDTSPLQVLSRNEVCRFNSSFILRLLPSGCYFYIAFAIYAPSLPSSDRLCLSVLSS